MHYLLSCALTSAAIYLKLTTQVGTSEQYVWANPSNFICYIIQLFGAELSLSYSVLEKITLFD